MNMWVRIFLATVVSFLTYGIVTQLQPERRRCAALVSIWNSSNGSLSTIALLSEQISQESGDVDLKFFADYLSTVASMNDDAGIHDLSELRKDDNIDVFATSFVNGIMNPIDSIKSLAKNAWLMWHRGDFVKAAQVVNARYNGLSDAGIFVGLSTGICVFGALKKWQMNRRFSICNFPVKDLPLKMLGN